MAGMGKSLERDPQMESILRNRTRELGLGIDRSRDLSRDLANAIPHDLGRSISRGLER
jgi:hypothetical protein